MTTNLFCVLLLFHCTDTISLYFGSFFNYFDKFLGFFLDHLPPTLTFSNLWTLTKSQHFLTTYAERSFFLGFFFPYFLLTSAFGHPHSPSLPSNLRNWQPPPNHLSSDIILEWSLMPPYPILLILLSICFDFTYFLCIYLAIYLCMFKFKVVNLYEFFFSK